MGDPCVVGVKVRIQSFEMIKMGGNAGGVWNIDREHCTSISSSFFVYRAALHDGGFVRAWNGISILQNWPFALKHVDYCCCVIMNACVLSYVTPLYLLLISYLADTSLCGNGRLKISYIWNCCALSCIGTSISSKNYLSAISMCVLRYW